jgi:hypothetical protein
MAAYSHSPRVAGHETASLRARGPTPTTPDHPDHSPYGSLRSSLSLRTPVHTLTLHEYRKQQSTPVSRVEAPPRKTLRRKTAAFALNELERVPLVSRTLRSDSRSLSHPLHSSQSAYQLLPQQYPFESQPAQDQTFRSLSAEPRIQSGSATSEVVSTTSSKFRQFGARKRLPRPTADRSRAPPPLAINTKASNQWAQPPRLIRYNPPSRASFLADEPRWSDAPSTATPSTFSLSRFPQPPQLADPSFSPPPDDKAPSQANAFSFATAAPATPPATPAIIHYRGASFDLINPHPSLQYRDIVTPSRDLDSSEYLPLQTSEDQFEIYAEVRHFPPLETLHWLTTEQMAPKRILYGDLNTAHAGIMRCADDPLGLPNFNMPLPPMPAAVSPDSSGYTSPFYSPESNLAPSPLHVRKPAVESRFSIKNLTRSLTKRLGKTPDPEYEQEMKEFYEPILRDPSMSQGNPSPPPLDSIYAPAHEASYFPGSPMTPISPMSSEFPRENQDQSVHGRQQTGLAQGPNSEGLTSLIPDSTSIEVGRTEVPHDTMTQEEHSSRPYYDDLESIYASSSIYTADDTRMSRYGHSVTSHRQSNAFLRFSGMNASEHAQEYSYDTLRRTSRLTSGPTSTEFHGRSGAQGAGKTDTISKFIDRYDPGDTTHNSSNLHDDQTSRNLNTIGSDSDGAEEEFCGAIAQPIQQGPFQPTYDASCNDSALQNSESHVQIQPVIARKFPSIRHPGLPPTSPAPLAPAFEYDDLPYLPQPPAPAELYSRVTDYSYGDTRNLLQLSPSDETALPVLHQEGLQPSSSYSQPEAKAVEPSSSYSQDDSRGVLQYTEYVVEKNGQPSNNTTTEQSSKNPEIPAMWSRRGSIGLPRNKRCSHRSSAGRTVGDDKADWETIDGDSQRGRVSLDSIANYSSSEEGEPRHSPVQSPQWSKAKHSQFLNYIHPSPPSSRANAFKSSPQFGARTSIHTAPEIFSPTTMSSPRESITTPAFHYRSRPIDYLGNGTVEEPRETPWASPYTLSKKETQELLASGPNDDILFDADSDRGSDWLGSQPRSLEPQNDTPSIELSRKSRRFGFVPAPARRSSSSESLPFDVSVERQNTLRKLSCGSKEGLRDMYVPSSSVKDSSSPNNGPSYRAARQKPRAEYPDFYACPYPATGSETRVQQGQVYPLLKIEKSPSGVTLFPSAYSLEPVQPSSPLAGPTNRISLGNSTKFRPTRQSSRHVAVPGQTKLREMFLAPSGSRSITSSQQTRFSQLMREATRPERPSTGDTTTPLRTEGFRTTTLAPPLPIVAHRHSPHLLCPRREAKPENEERRRKLSWFIFAMFCIFPPCMFLYRFWGDSIVVSVTKGQLGHCTARSKRVAFIAGIFVNMGLITAVLVPVLGALAFRTA